MPAQNPKLRAHEIQRTNLLKELQKLLSRLENPQMTPEQLEQIKADLLDYQTRYEALGFSKPGATIEE